MEVLGLLFHCDWESEKFVLVWEEILILLTLSGMKWTDFMNLIWVDIQGIFNWNFNPWSELKEKDFHGNKLDL